MKVSRPSVKPLMDPPSSPAPSPNEVKITFSKSEQNVGLHDLPIPIQNVCGLIVFVKKIITNFRCHCNYHLCMCYPHCSMNNTLKLALNSCPYKHNVGLTLSCRVATGRIPGDGAECNCYSNTQHQHESPGLDITCTDYAELGDSKVTGSGILLTAQHNDITFC